MTDPREDAVSVAPTLAPFQLDGASVDLAARQVTRGTAVARLSPKAGAVLEALVNADGAVLSRTVLLNTVWPDVTVGEEVLTTAVAQLRRAFGDTRSDPRLIETVQKSGYRLLQPPSKPTEPTASAPLQSSDNAKDPADQGWVAPGAPSVAVLPFEWMGDPFSEIVANGISRDISGTLSRSRALFVSRLASVAAASTTDRDSHAVAAKLGVRYLLDGSVIALDGRIRVTASLIDTRNTAEIWAERFDRPASDLFIVIDEVSAAVANCVEGEIYAREQRLAQLKPIASLDAWGLFHRARTLMVRFDPSALDNMDAMLSTAHRLAPGSSRILAARAAVGIRRHLFEAHGPGGSARLDDAIRLASESAAIDPRDPHAQLALARSNAMRGRPDDAEGQYLKALSLNPNDPLCHYYLGYHRLFGAHFGEALEAVTLAKRLSPFDPMMHGFMGLEAQVRIFEGDADGAATAAEQALAGGNPTVQSRAIAAWVLQAAGRTDAAQLLAAQVREERPDFSRNMLLSWFRFSDEQRAIADNALTRVGL